jgi:outer membrane protein OmpA-like peptidoglycan-associated protein
MERVFGSPLKHAHQDSEHWMSVSDLMSGLMIVFLFVSVAMLHFVRVERDRIKEIAVAYRDTQVTIYKELEREFAGDLEGWGAEIDADTLEVRFLDPELLFEHGRSNLRPSFREVLDEFLPRYFSVLTRHMDRIEEIRIEGHTSSDWAHGVSVEAAFFKNMSLSQSRTREVLEYSILRASSNAQRDWIRRKVAAVGFSSSRPVLDRAGGEDPHRSRRVAFRVLTDSETQLKRIIDTPVGAVP